MNCIMCENKKQLKRRVVTKKYKESGLDNVVLRGVEHFKCERCGEEYFGFGNLDQLHGLIAKALIYKKGPLRGKEVRFLRTYLGYSGKMFAALTGFTKETLSRFENEKQPISKTFDVLVRTLVVTKLPNRDYDFHDWWLQQKGTDSKRVELEAKGKTWHLKTAA